MGWDFQEMSTILDILTVGDIGRNLVLLNSREQELGGTGGEVTRGDIVGTDRTGDSVVVYVGACVLFDILWPDTTTIGCVIALS